MNKVILALVLVIVIGGAGFYVWQHNSSTGSLGDLSKTTRLSDLQVSELVARVSKFLVVPLDEKPSAVVIHNPAELAAQQSFYKDAKDGDVLLVYSNRTIIYDPKSNKLVNVGPVIRNENPPPSTSVSPTASASASFSPSPSVTPKLETIKIDVLNGTTTPGLATSTANTIKKNVLFVIGKVGDAKNKYTETTVVDLTKNSPGKSASVVELAKALGNAKVVTALPTGEVASIAEVVVFLGK